MKWVTVILLSVVFIVAVAFGALYWKSQSVIEEEVEKLKQNAAADFKDPDSVKFRSLRLTASVDFWGNLRQIGDMDFDEGQLSLPEWIDYLTMKFNFYQLCGEVNAKNAFGAYVGYRRFYISEVPAFNADGERNTVLYDSDTLKVATSMCELDGDEIVLYSEQ